MRKLRRMLLLILSVVLIVTPVVNPLNTSPIWHPGSSTIETDKIIIQIKGKQPHFSLWLKDMNETISYFIKFNNLFEFKDEDGDGRYEVGEEVYAIAYLMEKMQHSGGWLIDHRSYVNGSVTENRIRMTKIVNVYKMRQMMRDGEVLGEINITLILHIFDKDVTINGVNVKANLEVKIDIILGKWPWFNKDSLLGLSIIIGGEGKHASNMFEERSTIKHDKVEERKIMFAGKDADYGAYFSYVNEAIVSGAEKVKVEHSEETLSKLREHMGIDERGFKWVTLIYPHYNGVLEHDPTIGIQLPIDNKLLPSEINFIIITSVVLMILSITVMKVFYSSRKLDQ